MSRIVILAITAVYLITAQADSVKKNKLVEFKSFDQWEVWCIDIEQSGRIQCNLNQVLRYKNHPDFRAMILRFFVDNKAVSRLVFDKEWQSSFSRAKIEVDGFDSHSLAQCKDPCVIENQQLNQILTQFKSAKAASIHFHDYLIESFTVPISLNGFSQAVESLITMQSRYLPADS